MEHYEVNTGPRIRTEDAGIPGEATNSSDRSTHPWGVMTGFKYQISRNFAITPRLNWNMDQQLNTTTIGLNFFIRLI